MEVTACLLQAQQGARVTEELLVMAEMVQMRIQPLEKMVMKQEEVVGEAGRVLVVAQHELVGMVQMESVF